MSKNDTKECPFCGNEAVFVNHNGGEVDVQCSCCFARGPIQPTEGEAVLAWNDCLRKGNVGNIAVSNQVVIPMSNAASNLFFVDTKHDEQTNDANKPYTPVGVPCQYCDHLHDKRSGWCNHCGRFNR